MATREPLNRERILDVALVIADEAGLSGLSMRRLAKALSVEAMALYNHVANKTAILDGLAERVFAEVETPDPALPWPERVRALATSMHAAFGRHPVVPLALVTDQANPTTLAALRPLEALIGAFAEAGFDDEGLRRALSSVNALVYGTLALTTVGFGKEPGGSSGPEQLDVFVRKVDPAKLPHFSRLLASIPGADPETDFAWALDRLIAGLEAAAPGPGTAS
jgi:TetR/AcrR family tetracycline transcriptional repressor